MPLGCLGGGQRKTKYLFQDDCASALLFLMNAAYCPKVVNVAPQKEISLGEIAEIVKKAFGYEGVLEYEEGKENGADRFMSAETLYHLGWRPEKPVEERLRELCVIYSQTKY